MTVTTVTAASAPAAIAGVVAPASRVFFLGTEGPAATTRVRQIRVASGREFFKDAGDLRLYAADAMPATVRAIAACVVAEQIVAPSLVITEHTAFAGLTEADLAALFSSANVLRIAG